MALQEVQEDRFRPALGLVGHRVAQLLTWSCKHRVASASLAAWLHPGRRVGFYHRG